MHLAGVEGDELVAGAHEQPPVAVYSLGHAAPVGPRHLPSRQRVARAEGGDDIVVGDREPPVKCAQELVEGGLDLRRVAPERRGGVAQLRREVIGAQRDVEADPEHHPPFL